MIPAIFGGSPTSAYRGLLVAAAGGPLVLAGGAGGEGKPEQAGGIGSGAGAFDSHRSAPAAPIERAAEGGTVTVLMQAALGHNRLDCPCDTMDPTGAYVIDGSSILSGLV